MLPSRAAGHSSRGGVRRRPARTLPWQAMREQTASRRSRSAKPWPFRRGFRRRSLTSPSTSVSPSSAGISRTATAPWPKPSSTSPSSASSSAFSTSAAASSSPTSTMAGMRSPWRATPPLLEHLLHALVDEALVGGMLIDDDDGGRASAPRCRFRAAVRERHRADSRASRVRLRPGLQSCPRWVRRRRRTAPAWRRQKPRGR